MFREIHEKAMSSEMKQQQQQQCLWWWHGGERKNRKWQIFFQREFFSFSKWLEPIKSCQIQADN